ncbi:MAG: Radical SAM domain protein [Candidatus Woesebacteria bacterium GW2011_GWB1_43_14]|uniref:Radical SAM domain protein n=1 Tax=Candidatus Woesebacteria bacterium GW2011_GWB1_43_14 TaxID=1618578 RepID=A0A0G1DI17_9BACT|nr:MAG: Radical SAM domain protein [Candidatus Woesebacteria bacterium GW2011_GWA1_39_11b]KKS78375.1 MAG: Radical SAM domain protein [Candidatus Woesebacteria bacterium GW2011_GWC1_42_9]KKS97207.1 MAG: Radical SAM domain protein [Candidatus Woesebacteria bacterium GW2011_GWB1_43_14]
MKLMVEGEPRFPTTEELVPTKYPPQVLLDVTNRCPLSCIRCPVPILRKEPGYHPSDMPLPLFQKLADQMSNSSILTITGDGEPLVVRDLPKMVHYATEKGITVRLITSGLILSERVTRELLESQLDFIDFSLDAATEESYNQVRLDSNYRKVIGNVNRFLELRNEIQGENPTTKVLVSMIDQPETHHEIADFFTLWQNRADRVYVRPLHSVAGYVPMESRKDVGNSPSRIPCRILWDRLVVNHKGDVYFCPLGWGRKEALLGNINQETIQEIWNGDSLNQIRENHIGHNIPGGILCHNCPDWRSFTWGDSSGQYLRELLEKS